LNDLPIRQVNGAMDSQTNIVRGMASALFRDHSDRKGMWIIGLQEARYSRDWRTGSSRQ
jgi:hypothetical protein